MQCLARQTHCEHRALARLARHHHVTAHHARELVGDGKAEARAAKLLYGRGIGLAELLEMPAKESARSASLPTCRS
jgi:hypothetical protein